MKLAPQPASFSNRLPPAKSLPKSELIALALALADALDASAARLRAKSAAGRARAADLRRRADELDRHALATLAAEGRAS